MLLWIHLGWAAECSLFNGPEWEIDCRETRPGEYEWSTCLNATFVTKQSGNILYCKYARAQYCWVTCSVQKHYLKPSKLLPVPEDCTCNPDEISPTSFVPSKCYSPAGDSCDWYRDCLEKSHPCEATTNSYAIGYAEKICKLYDDRKSKFSATGQKWIDGVRKCLQEALVPLLRPWNKPTCLDIRQKALDSHTPCYLNPGKDVPSICDLDCSEYFKIFFTIKGSFTKLDTAWKSLEGMWNIGTECAINKCISDGFREVKKGADIVKEEFIRAFKILLKSFQPKRKRRASVDKPIEVDNQSRFADAVGSAIAEALDWDADLMDWLAYPSGLRNDSGASVTTEIIMVLADKKAIGIVHTSKTSANFNKVAQELGSAIEKGKLPLRVSGSNVWLVSLASCSGKSCNETEMLAMSDKPPKWDVSADGICCGNIGICGCVYVASLIMIINNLFL